MGAAGFLGSALSKKLAEDGARVTRIWNSTKPAEGHLVQVDDFVSLRRWDLDVVVNCAVNYGRTSAEMSVESNLIMPLQVLKKCRDNQVTFLNIASFFQKFAISTYAPLKNYSLSKSLFSNVVDEIGRSSPQLSSPWAINIFLEHLYGPNDRAEKFVPTIIRKMLNSEKEIHLTHGWQRRDFVYVDDAVEMISGAVRRVRELPSEIFPLEVGTGISTSVREFVGCAAKTISWDGELLWGSIPPPEGEPTLSGANGKLAQFLGKSEFLSIDNGLDLIKRASE